ncbi:MAG: hypothetical protein AB1631_07750 [Acidobacteriota bacterium]
MGKKIELGLPDKLELYHRGSAMEIVRKWFGWQIVFMTAFAIFWDGFLFIWYSKVGDSAEPMSMYFPLLHVAVGIGLTYYVVAGWLNRTHILVSRGKIAVRHAPLPWVGNTELEVSNLKQLYAKEKRSRSDNGTSTTYEVHAIAHNGRTIKLVRGLETREQALYIEQEIEKYLGIEDIPDTGTDEDIEASAADKLLSAVDALGDSRFSEFSVPIVIVCLLAHFGLWVFVLALPSTVSWICNWLVTHFEGNSALLLIFGPPFILTFVSVYMVARARHPGIEEESRIESGMMAGFAYRQRVNKRWQIWILSMMAGMLNCLVLLWLYGMRR